MSELTQERLKELLEYNPDTGDFIWKVARQNKTVAGLVAGSVSSSGYSQIKIDGKTYLTHILAWLYMKGTFPESRLDHRDNNILNNKWDNLRPATHQQNMFNRKLGKNNKSGVKGVSYAPKYDHYTVRISNIYYGCYKTLEEAKAVAEKVRQDLHGEFVNYG